MKFSLKLSIPGVLALSVIASIPARGEGAAESQGPMSAAINTVEMSDVPAIVKATLDRELPGATLTAGSISDSNGGGVYDLNVVQLEHEWNVRIASSGDLVMKRRR